ncbi:hypothetical protein ACH5RR_001226 [Cinchona calisaya]|uniref:Uncharacterized protein n=1 Tax=Cinchona calisaya TaxID=153742 RepID=A0ABD3B3C1_9GENT
MAESGDLKFEIPYDDFCLDLGRFDLFGWIGYYLAFKSELEVFHPYTSCRKISSAVVRGGSTGRRRPPLVEVLFVGFWTFVWAGRLFVVFYFCGISGHDV